ncbi:alpha/beta hydrolase [Acidomonas methanolica]|uniref:alpha/beta hydrolase n=1 Tax=Acidomonas methanolica TaxID=437 RepID=UPI002119D341|nr:alpha/beta hydrolase [Acidomonas methanolica]MCQ9154219.1 lysophospholipase [Acidomonas methanolica]
MPEDDPGRVDRQVMEDGVALARRDWPLPGAERGVLLVHGYGEHSGRYAHLAAWFRARGYAVRSYDHRGHGLSPGRRGAIRRLDDLPRDLATVYRSFAQDLPHEPLLFGHSMGGLTAARAVLEGRVAPPRLILSSPALRLPVGRALGRVARLLARIAPGLPIRAGISPADLSHDAAFGQAARSDPLGTGWITLSLVDYFLRAGEACIRDAPALSVPTLLLAAGADRVVDPQGSIDFAAAAPAGRVELHLFEGLYHEIFNEPPPGGEIVFETLEAWLSGQVREG